MRYVFAGIVCFVAGFAIAEESQVRTEAEAEVEAESMDVGEEESFDAEETRCANFESIREKVISGETLSMAELEVYESCVDYPRPITRMIGLSGDSDGQEAPSFKGPYLEGQEWLPKTGIPRLIP